MKFLSKLTLLLVIGTLSGANSQETFIGTWENQVGNEIFRVILDIDLANENTIIGHYEKVVVNDDGVQSFIYCSDKEKYAGNNKGWLPFAISATGDNNEVEGTIHDNTVDENLYAQQKIGSIKLKFINGSSNTIRWFVQRKSYQSGLTSNEAPNFSVPTEVILAKVE